MTSIIIIPFTYELAKAKMQKMTSQKLVARSKKGSVDLAFPFCELNRMALDVSLRWCFIRCAYFSKGLCSFAPPIYGMKAGCLQGIQGVVF